MDHLYVCLWSNGHIKVGRSIDPTGRIAAHVERVSCVGVHLVRHHVCSCAGPSQAREALLIDRCADACEQRHKNEWFEGLDFAEVCGWADEAATTDQRQVSKPDAFNLRLATARKRAGLTQLQLAKGMGVGGRDLQKASVSGWELGMSSPNVQQLRLICDRLQVSPHELLYGPIEAIPRSPAPATSVSSPSAGAVSHLVLAG